MKKITIEIDDKAFKEIKQEIGLKMMVGNAYGFVDEFIILFVKSVEANKELIQVIKRQEGQKKTVI